MFRIDHSNVMGPLDTDAARALDQVGSLAGEQVRVRHGRSMLANARDENRALYSQNADDKAFGDWQISADLPTRTVSIEQIRAYLHAAHHHHRDPKLLHDMMRRLQASRNPRALSRKKGGSATEQYALLALALDDAHKRVMPVDELEQLEDALEELEQESGDEIHAGLNTVEAAAQFDPAPEAIANFQQAYTDIVLGESTFAKTLLVVLKRLSGQQGEDFQRGLHALLHALGADLSATRSSTDPRRLQALVQDVHQLEIAGSVLDECRKLSDTFQARYGIGSVVPMALMQELVQLTSERWVTPQRLRALAQKFAIAALLARIAFHTGTRNAARKMPERVFVDADARMSVLDTMQTVLDETIAEEEERQGT